ncbi:MAG: class I SAM-dependent methyltransferase [Halochromatium sp.]|uniref:class I SAM-dependent methyltransferase n=1 Tax=Halochromatium sp. TaxID=2049430 RepID=UPI00397A2FF6
MPRVDTESFYRHALARYGENAEGVHWRSTESQQIRFAVLRELLPPDLSRLSLVDVGCGLGDLHAFLAKHDDLPRQYIGLDAVPVMVERARARTGCAILHCDVLSDPLPAADWYLASGAMALLTHEETGLFIDRCLAAARHGLVFNLLKGQHDSMTFNYLMPETIEAWAAERNLGLRIVDGYLSGDFSVAMTHPQPENPGAEGGNQR